MKNLTLSSLALATIIGITPASIYPVDATKDGITIRVSNEHDRSEILKSNDLACFYVRIKNDTGAPVELPKYAVSSPFIANEGTITEVIGATKKIGACMTKFILGTGIHLAPCFAIYLYVEHYRWNDLLMGLSILGRITSPLTGATWAITSYLKQAPVRSMLQEYLDRKATTIQTNGEVGLYVYVNLDQYQRSIGKNITIRLHKKDTEQVVLFDIDTTDLLQAQTT